MQIKQMYMGLKFHALCLYLLLHIIYMIAIKYLKTIFSCLEAKKEFSSVFFQKCEKDVGVVCFKALNWLSKLCTSLN